MRYVLNSEFKHGSAALYWEILDTASGRKVAEVYTFDGSAALVCDALNAEDRQLAEKSS